MVFLVRQSPLGVKGKGECSFETCQLIFRVIYIVAFQAQMPHKTQKTHPQDHAHALQHELLLQNEFENLISCNWNEIFQEIIPKYVSM